MLNIQKQCLFIFIGILGLLVVPVTGEDAPNIETQVETVVIGGHPTAQLSYDSSGIPYILTLSSDNKNLILFSKVNNTWISDIIDSNYEGSSELSFSVDKNGNPHFCFYQTENNTITSYYSRILNGIREDFVIGHVNGNPRLFLDRGDRAHFLYRNCTTNDQCSLIHSWLDGSNFISETIESVWGLDDIDVAFDPSNNIHVAYGSSNGYNGLQSLKYAYKSGDDWNIEIIDIAGSGDCKCNIAGVSIDLGSDNKPHIAYIFGWWTSGPIKYAYLNDQNIWEFSIIDNSYGGGELQRTVVYDSPKLVVDGKNQPLIAYSSRHTDASGYSIVNSSIILDYKKEGIWYKATLYYKDDSAMLLCSSFNENCADNLGLQFYEYYPKLGTGDNSIKYLRG